MTAVSHIQNTAPAPPAEIAATTPTRFPMPTRVAVETIRDWREESEPPFAPFFSSMARSMSGNRRMGRKRVRRVNQIPVGIRRITRSDSPREPPPGRGMTNKSPHKKL